MKKIIFSIVILIASCKNTPQQIPSIKIVTEQNVIKNSTAKPVYTASMLSYKYDPTCGMPISAGLSDTCHYKNKVIGFCSQECKAEFLKTPDTYLAAIKQKK